MKAHQLYIYLRVTRDTYWYAKSINFILPLFVKIKTLSWAPQNEAKSTKDSKAMTSSGCKKFLLTNKNQRI